MNKESRTRLRKVVAQARALLEEDVKTQLNRFGIEEGGETVPIGRLGHLGPNDAELRDKILASINKEQGKRIERSEAYDRYVRHVGFTYLNRIAALRAMEVRGLFEKETVIRRDKYAGLSERAYLISERQDVNDSGESTRLCFIEAFGEVSQEIKVLFDVNDEYSVLFPSPGVLEKVIQLISVDVPEDDWREEDVIGWIYQYYNSEAREELRKKRRKLRADDVPVVNQFYTSHWLVRALVDNTLGRLWLEMKGRMPKPGSGLAPSPEHLRNPYGDKVDEYCSYLIPSGQETPARERKPVRDIKVLDPACGSGHFLVYAFNVLYRMYLEDEPQTPKEEIPRLILENNLFGIDIDLRSVQLAALSLYLKAKENNRNTKITKMNLVCADVRIINGDLKKAFMKRLEPDIDLQKIFIKLFEELEYTFDIGSLLKVRAPFEKLIEERGPQSHFQVRPSGQTAFSKSGLSSQTSIHFDGQTAAANIQPTVTLSEMLDALISFEKEGLEKKDMGSMLFAAEAEKSVGLLALLSQKYDVVVMNPPYGDLPESSKEYVKAHYPRTYYDYYATFIEQAVDLGDANSFVGMLTGRTFMFLKWFEKVRTEILFKEARSELVFDLNSSPGDNILDEATARWAATIARKLPLNKIPLQNCCFIRLINNRGEDEKIKAFNKAISDFRCNGQSEIIYFLSLDELSKLPRMPYSYWVPQSISTLFMKYPPLDRDIAEKPDQSKVASLKQGLATADDERFVRYWWEVNSETIALARDETFLGKKWVPFAKGGQAYYSDVLLLVNWGNNGEEIKSFEKAVVRNEDLYFKRGLCWSAIVSSVLIDMRPFPSEAIFSVKAHSLFRDRCANFNQIMGYVNSSLAAFLFVVLNPTMHDRNQGYMASLPVSPKVLENEELSKIVKSLNELKEGWSTGDELSPNFTKPWILQILDEKNAGNPARHPMTRNKDLLKSLSKIKELLVKPKSSKPSIDELASSCSAMERSLKIKLASLQKLIDMIVFDIYNVSENDRLFIANELLTLEGLSKTADMSEDEEISQEISVKEHVARLISYFVIQVAEKEPDGIIPSNKLVEGIRKQISVEFGIERREEVESDIVKIIGMSIEKYLANYFFSFHVTLYRRRPILWQLTSVSFGRSKTAERAFNCFLYYKKLSKDTLPKIRSRPEYLKGILDGAKWKTEGLRKEIQKINLGDKREHHLQAEYGEAQAELSELQAFDQKLAEVSNPRGEPTRLDKNASWVEQKIAEVRDNGWSPVIDYGVRVNIEALKEARLLHSAVDRVK